MLALMSSVASEHFRAWFNEFLNVYFVIFGFLVTEIAKVRYYLTALALLLYESFFSYI